MSQPDDLSNLTTEELFNLAYQHYTPQELAERDRMIQKLHDAPDSPLIDADRQFFREFWQSLSESNS